MNNSLRYYNLSGNIGIFFTFLVALASPALVWLSIDRYKKCAQLDDKCQSRFIGAAVFCAILSIALIALPIVIILSRQSNIPRPNLESPALELRTISKRGFQPVLV